MGIFKNIRNCFSRKNTNNKNLIEKYDTVRFVRCANFIVVLKCEMIITPDKESTKISHVLKIFDIDDINQVDINQVDINPLKKIYKCSNIVNGSGYEYCVGENPIYHFKMGKPSSIKHVPSDIIPGTLAKISKYSYVAPSQKHYLTLKEAIDERGN